MAAPPELTIKDLTGEFVMNKTLSDDVEPALALQGISWFTRKAIGLATVTLHIKQYVEDGITHIDIDQTATGGIKGTFEPRVLTWEEHPHSDHIFGELRGKSRWVDLDAVEDPFLKEGWLDGDEEKGGPNGELHVQGYVINDAKGWTADQIWGFAIIDGARYYTRRVVIKKGDEVRKIRMVYSYNGQK